MCLCFIPLSLLLQAEHREWDQMLGSPSPKKMIGNGHLPDIHNKDVRKQRNCNLFADLHVRDPLRKALM
jgi:hypothetical protein